MLDNIRDVVLLNMVAMPLITANNFFQSRGYFEVTHVEAFD